MMLLIVGLMVFLGIHLLPTVPDVRNGIRDRVSEISYRMLFSVIAFMGLVLIVLGYHKMQMAPGKNPIIWDPPSWTHHLSALLMLPAMIFLVASQFPSKIRTALQHPMLVAVKIWALAHLLSNGDAASLVLFGSFFIYAVYDRISVKTRRTELGRREPGPADGDNDIAVVLIGLALYAALLFGGHEMLFGKAPLG